MQSENSENSTASPAVSQTTRPVRGGYVLKKSYKRNYGGNGNDSSVGSVILSGGYNLAQSNQQNRERKIITKTIEGGYVKPYKSINTKYRSDNRIINNNKGYDMSLNRVENSVTLINREETGKRLDTESNDNKALNDNDTQSSVVNTNGINKGRTQSQSIIIPGGYSYTPVSSIKTGDKYNKNYVTKENDSMNSEHLDKKREHFSSNFDTNNSYNNNSTTQRVIGTKNTQVKTTIISGGYINYPPTKKNVISNYNKQENNKVISNPINRGTAFKEKINDSQHSQRIIAKKASIDTIISSTSPTHESFKTKESSERNQEDNNNKQNAEDSFLASNVEYIQIRSPSLRIQPQTPNQQPISSEEQHSAQIHSSHLPVINTGMISMIQITDEENRDIIKAKNNDDKKSNNNDGSLNLNTFKASKNATIGCPPLINIGIHFDKNEDNDNCFNGYSNFDANVINQFSNNISADINEKKNSCGINCLQVDTLVQPNDQEYDEFSDKFDRYLKENDIKSIVIPKFDENIQNKIQNTDENLASIMSNIAFGGISSIDKLKPEKMLCPTTEDEFVAGIQHYSESNDFDYPYNGLYEYPKSIDSLNEANKNKDIDKFFNAQNLDKITTNNNSTINCITCHGDPFISFNDRTENDLCKDYNGKLFSTNNDFHKYDGEHNASMPIALTNDFYSDANTNEFNRLLIPGNKECDNNNIKYKRSRSSNPSYTQGQKNQSDKLILNSADSTDISSNNSFISPKQTSSFSLVPDGRISALSLFTSKNSAKHMKKFNANRNSTNSLYGINSQNREYNSINQLSSTNTSFSASNRAIHSFTTGSTIQICPEYAIKGYCPRGDECKMQHITEIDYMRASFMNEEANDSIFSGKALTPRKSCIDGANQECSLIEKLSNISINDDDIIMPLVNGEDDLMNGFKNQSGNYKNGLPIITGNAPGKIRISHEAINETENDKSYDKDITASNIVMSKKDSCKTVVYHPQEKKTNNIQNQYETKFPIVVSSINDDTYNNNNNNSTSNLNSMDDLGVSYVQRTSIKRNTDVKTLNEQNNNNNQYPITIKQRSNSNSDPIIIHSKEKQNNVTKHMSFTEIYMQALKTGKKVSINNYHKN